MIRFMNAVGAEARTTFKAKNKTKQKQKQKKTKTKKSFLVCEL